MACTSAPSPCPAPTSGMKPSTPVQAVAHVRPSTSTLRLAKDLTTRRRVQASRYCVHFAATQTKVNYKMKGGDLEVWHAEEMPFPELRKQVKQASFS